jgi:hypothetical protein
MARRTGYLSSIDNIPPLVFRFQFNPDILSDKKSYKYDPAPSFGLWSFDQTSAASGVVGVLTGLLGDVKDIASLLINTRPLEPKEGDPRQVTLEFKLDASVAGPLDPQGTPHGSYVPGQSKGTILPDLAILRSFMAPSWSITDVLGMIPPPHSVPCFNRPPSCSVSYAHVTMTGVMTDLDIKVTDFFDDGDPRRAEINCTVKEQSYSLYPIVDLITRVVGVSESMFRPGFGIDVLDSQLPTFISNSIPLIANR